MGHRNYAAKTLTLLSQYHLTLPRNLAEQLKWSRCVNVHGLPGHNISCDLHMEHLNRLVKGAIEGLGANKSRKAMIRSGKAIGLLATVTKSFDAEVGVTKTCGKHSVKNSKRDLQKIIQELLQQNVFAVDSTRSHKSFTFKRNIVKKLKVKELKEWMILRFTSDNM